MSMLFANDMQGEHAPSLYAANGTRTSHPPLCEPISADVCVIGAGYTGLSAALHCVQSGLSVAVIDAHRVGWGASGRNGGQLGSGFNMSQEELEKRMGSARAKALWSVAEDAKNTIHQLCRQHGFDIEYQAGIISASHRRRYVKAAHHYCDTLSKKYQYQQLEPLSKQQLKQYVNSPAYFGGVLDHGAGHINPLKLAFALADIATESGAQFFEQSQVLSIESNSDHTQTVRTESGSVKSGYVVIACNGYAGNLNSVLQKHTMPINNFIVATESLGEGALALLPERHAVFDSRFVVNYFRLSQDNRLVFGGGETYGYQFPNDIRNIVSKPLLDIFPQLEGVKFEYAWGGTLAITRSRLPFISKLSETTYCAGGYSGHGVALAVETGKAIAASIAGKNGSFNVLKDLPCAPFPGGRIVRPALLASAMTWYSLLDRV